MSTPKKKPKRLTGGPAMMAAGFKVSQLWYTPEQYDLVKKAAEFDQRPMTKFAILATLAAADQVVKKHNGHSSPRGPKGVSRG